MGRPDSKVDSSDEYYDYVHNYSIGEFPPSIDNYIDDQVAFVALFTCAYLDTVPDDYGITSSIDFEKKYKKIRKEYLKENEISYLKYCANEHVKDIDFMINNLKNYFPKERKQELKKFIDRTLKYLNEKSE